MNYHLLIVDSLSFKYHLEFGFIGTGNNNTTFNIGLWKDISRLKIEDKIIFYVQSVKKFYGFFKITSLPFFDISHYLQPQPLPFLGNNSIKLTYRALIEPDIVFPLGINEFDLIDILPYETKNVLWSILYRKLKGARGCSPIFKVEYDIIFDRISTFNNNSFLINTSNLTYEDSLIKNTNISNIYRGNTHFIHDTKGDILNNNYSEHHLHSLLIECLPTIVFDNIIWFGNEIYAGAGMQAIDILSISNNNVFYIVEVKKDEISNTITTQIEKYLIWLKNRFSIHQNSKFQPVIIGRKIVSTRKKNNRKSIFLEFNNKNISNSIKYIEYSIDQNQGNIILDEVDYLNNWTTIRSIFL